MGRLPRLSESWIGIGERVGECRRGRMRSGSPADAAVADRSSRREAEEAGEAARATERIPALAGGVARAARAGGVHGLLLLSVLSSSTVDRNRTHVKSPGGKECVLGIPLFPV